MLGKCCIIMYKVYYQICIRTHSGAATLVKIQSYPHRPYADGRPSEAGLESMLCLVRVDVRPPSHEQKRHTLCNPPLLRVQTGDLRLYFLSNLLLYF